MNTRLVGIALQTALLALLASCASDPPDPARAMQRAMVGCARQIPADYVANTTPKIYYVHRDGDRYLCDWSFSNRSDTTQDQLIAHVSRSYPDAEIVAINDQMLVQVPPKKPKKVDSGPSWAEIFLNGAAQISAAYAGRTAPTSTYYASAPTHSVRSPAPQSQQSSLRAPYVSPSCARLTVDAYEPVLGSNLYNWENVCAYPIQVDWCWVPKGRTTCKPDYASRTLSPGEKQQVVGGGGKEKEVPAYFVCDMSRRELSCVAAE